MTAARRLLCSLSLFSAGCPWIGPEAHRAAQEGPGGDLGPDADADADADADTDADADADTDADADADTDTDTSAPPCLDDGLEEDDRASQASEVLLLPYLTSQRLCPDDDGPADWTTGRLRAGQTLRAALVETTEPCSTQALRLTLLAADGVTELAFAEGACPSLEGAPGEGLYYLQVKPLDDRPQAYGLSIEALACTDADRDGYLPSACGGEDCDDTDARVYPGAREVPGDDRDQDCDGFDALGTCPLTGAFSEGQAEDLACDGEGRWDHWVVEVDAGSCVELVVDNDPTAVADLEAELIDPDGFGAAGTRPGSPELDDDLPCSWGTWSGGACPVGAFVARSAGLAVLRVRQREASPYGGLGCAPDAPYTLFVAVDGLPAEARLVEDDVLPK